MTRSQSSRLFDPPSLDDLDYLPDPLGRLGMGSYDLPPGADAAPGWEEARAQWRGGASMASLFGDRAFDLQGRVGAGQANRRADVFRLQSLLHREGYLDAGATEGPTGYWGGRDDYALRRFQKDNGLAIDGWAGPDGETIETLRGFYRPQPASPPVSPPVRLAQAGGIVASDAAAPAIAPAGKLTEIPAWQDPWPQSPIDPAFRALLHEKESSGVAGDGYGAENSGAYGRYQMRLPALKDAGLIDRNGNWGGGRSYGVGSPQDFLRNPAAQERAFAAFMAKTATSLHDRGLDGYIGREIDGTKARFRVTEAGLMAAAHRQGIAMLPLYFSFQQANGWKSDFDNIPERIARQVLALQRSLSEPQDAAMVFRSIETRLREFSTVPYRRGAAS